MVRNPNRQLTRIFFLIILTMAFFGRQYALANWQIDPQSLTFADLGEDSNWIDVVASLGEQALRLFLGLTNQ